MTSLYQQLGDPECAVVLAGRDGVICTWFLRRCSPMTFAGLGFRVGAGWSEREAGTNGMGTCVEAAAPVAVCRTDHFYPSTLAHLFGSAGVRPDTGRGPRCST
jgi:transcriptional regulator of acetoin/glycerol metabolism